MIEPRAAELLARYDERVEHFKTAAGGRVLAGAEGQAGVDLKRGCLWWNRAAIGRGMDKEATGADRLQALLAPGHPVRRILEMLDLGLADSEATKFG